MFVSAEQERLAALLEKVIAFVPFCSDATCSELSIAVASFGREALEQRDARRKREFFRLDLAKLIDVSKEETPKRERSETSAPAPLSNKFLKKETPDRPIQSSKWSFEEAYNIVSVTSVVDEPFFVDVLAKPPIAGNQKPIAYVFDLDAFKSISKLKGRKATKLKKTLSAALLVFCKSDRKARPLVIANLRLAEWGSDLAAELEETLSPNK